MRMNWDTFWLHMAHNISERSTCQSGRRVGCVVAIDNRSLSMGFNGVPRHYPHPITCARRDAGVSSGKDLHLCVCSHAEVNAIANAACYGIALKGATLYCTTKPCQQCMGLIANAGIVRVVFVEDYEALETDKIAWYANVQLEQWTGE